MLEIDAATSALPITVARGLRSGRSAGFASGDGTCVACIAHRSRGSGFCRCAAIFN